MTLTEVFMLGGLAVSIVTLLSVAIKLIDVITDLRVAIATFTTELTEIKRRLSGIEGQHATFGSA